MGKEEVQKKGWMDGLEGIQKGVERERKNSCGILDWNFQNGEENKSFLYFLNFLTQLGIVI